VKKRDTTGCSETLVSILHSTHCDKAEDCNLNIIIIAYFTVITLAFVTCCGLFFVVNYGIKGISHGNRTGICGCCLRKIDETICTYIFGLQGS
jgi:hypothetical protein